jgi:hypothetical protein
MKNTGSRTITFVIFSFIAIVVIVVSLFGAVRYISPESTQIPTSTLLPVLTSTPDFCSQEGLQLLVTDFNRKAREFDDLSILANNTPREQLVPIISQLQEVRRSSEDYGVPPCMATLKEYQLAYMNVYINTLLALYSSLTSELTEEDVLLINQGLQISMQYHDQYAIEMARLLGVTLEPTPTNQNSPIPSSTETPTP